MMRFVRDTREKTGWDPPKHRTMVEACLPHGDYSVVGYTDRLAVERKSLDDLVGSLFSGPRFIERLSEMGAATKADPTSRFCVVAECTEKDIREAKYRPDARSTRRQGRSAAWAGYLDRLQPSTVFAAIAKAYAIYGVPFFLAGSPTRAATFAFTMMVHWHDSERAKQA